MVGISRARNLARVLLQTLYLSMVQMFWGTYRVPGTFCKWNLSRKEKKTKSLLLWSLISSEERQKHS